MRPVFGGILEHAPGIGSVAATLMSSFASGFEKSSTVLRMDAVFDRHQDRAAIALDILCSERRRPMHGWRQIDAGGGLQLPAPSQRNGRNRAGGSEKCATGRPRTAASSPQTALPSVRQPKNTVVYNASPRPRTQSGSATCAEQ